MAKLLRVAKYIRVSTDKQATTGDSLREQEETLDTYINSHSDMILVDTFIDDGISGQKLERNDFTKLMAKIKNNEIDTIIFTKLDRWFRSLHHYLNTQDILEKHGVTWTAVSQPFFDTTTAHGRAFVAQSMTWAELEAQNDSERIKAVFKNKAKNGEVLSGSVPFGYSIIDKHLMPNENAPKALAIFNHYHSTGKLIETTRFAERELGFVRTVRTIKRLLQNAKYIGFFRDNDTYCPPIVSKETFDEVQRLLSVNTKGNQKYEYVFSGLLVCGECGNRLVSRQNRCSGHIRKDGTRMVRQYSSYCCRYYMTYKRCSNSKVTFEKTLEKKLLENVRPQLEAYIASYEIKSKPLKQTNAKKHAITAKIDKLKVLYINDLITLDEYKIDKEKYLLQLEELEAVNSEPAKDLTPLKEFLKSDFEEIYNALSTKEKRRLWRSVIREIRIDNDKNMTIIFL